MNRQLTYFFIIQVVVLGASFPSLAAKGSFESFYTGYDKTVTHCPAKPEKGKKSEIAREIFELEFAGRRWVKAESSCFTKITAKYVHTSKNPDRVGLGLVKVKRGSLKFGDAVYNKDYYQYDVSFTVENEKGETVKDSISFMTRADFGAKKPIKGCAFIAGSPAKAFVYEDCL